MSEIQRRQPPGRNGGAAIGPRTSNEGPIGTHELLGGLLDSVFVLKACRDESGSVVDFSFADLNEPAAAALGLSREELLGERICERFPINRTAGFFDQYVRVLTSGEPLVQSFSIPPDQPAPGMYIHKVAPISDGVVISMHDVTELEQAREALARSEERFRRITTLIADTAYSGRLRGADYIQDWTVGSIPSFIDLQDGQQVAVGFGVHPDDHEILRERVEKLMAGEAHRSEYRLISGNGDVRWVIDHGLSCPDESEEGELRIIGAIRDITEEVRAREDNERLKQHSQEMRRLEMLGTMAAGIAHDFNNLLTPMMLGVESALALLRPDDEAGEELREVLLAAQRARGLIRDMLRVGRQTNPTLAPLDLADVVREALPLVRSGMAKAVELRTEMDERVMVLGDAGQLHQVVMNLMLNAAHAVGDRPGRITVSVARAPATKDDGRLPEGPLGLLTVSDDGPGMTEAVIARMFDPFFTTKAEGGSGLGLSMVRGIVDSHSGAVRVSSTPGEGTRVSVYLPLAESLEAAASDDAVPSTRGHVLLVDDTPLVAKTVSRTLSRAGFSVTVVSNGRIALDKLHTESFDLILTDYMMPEISGLQLLEIVRDSDLGVPVIVMSGFSDAVDQHRASEGAADAYLLKPFGSRELLEAVNKLIAA